MRRSARSAGGAGRSIGERAAESHPTTRHEWSPEDAVAIARSVGLGPMGDRHWKVIAACREEAARTGSVPGPEQIEVLTGFSSGELHQLFPGPIVSLISLIAGLAPPGRISHRPDDERSLEE